jgi:glutaredoxin
MGEVELYGRDWCEGTSRVRQGLDRRGIAYRYVNIGRDPQEGAWLRRQGSGWLRTPTLCVGRRLIPGPTDSDLRGIA